MTDKSKTWKSSSIYIILPPSIRSLSSVSRHIRYTSPRLSVSLTLDSFFVLLGRIECAGDLQKGKMLLSEMGKGRFRRQRWLMIIFRDGRHSRLALRGSPATARGCGELRYRLSSPRPLPWPWPRPIQSSREFCQSPARLTLLRRASEAPWVRR